MRIVLDATPLTVPTGGIRRYTAELARALAEQDGTHQVHLISDQPFVYPSPAPFNLRTAPSARNCLERRWWSVGLAWRLARLGADVFHGTDFSVPYFHLRPAVVTVHDLSPWREEWQPDAARIRKRTPWALRLGLADMVITPSEAVRQEVIHSFRLSSQRVVAVPLAAAACFRPPTAAPPSEAYFLCYGTLEPRKNLHLLIEAWREVWRRTGVELWIAGRTRQDARSIQTEPGIRRLGIVDDEALPGLISGASAVLYASLYEGFGLPVLEAMSCGGLVLASDLPAIREYAADAAVLLPPCDPQAWVEAMSAAAQVTDWAAKMRQAALRRASTFRWATTAALTLEVYAEAIRRFRLA